MKALEIGEQMKVQKIKNGVLLEVHVKPRSKRFKIQVNNELVVSCKEPPLEGKANRELIKELSKIFRRDVEIVSGLHSRTKKILIKKAAEDEVLKILEFVRKGLSV